RSRGRLVTSTEIRMSAAPTIAVGRDRLADVPIVTGVRGESDAVRAVDAGNASAADFRTAAGTEPPLSQRRQPREVPERFQVGLSFSGAEREFVRAIAEAVERRLGSSSVFFDEWYEFYIAGHDADVKLQRIYATGCELAVVCVSKTYGSKA